MSNGLDTDQARHSFGPDLCPYCLQRLSADDKKKFAAGRLKGETIPIKVQRIHNSLAVHRTAFKVDYPPN